MHNVIDTQVCCNYIYYSLLVGHSKLLIHTWSKYLSHSYCFFRGPLHGDSVFIWTFWHWLLLCVVFARYIYRAYLLIEQTSSTIQVVFVRVWIVQVGYARDSSCSLGRYATFLISYHGITTFWVPLFYIEVIRIAIFIIFMAITV